LDASDAIGDRVYIIWEARDILRRNDPFLLLWKLSLKTTRIFKSHVQKVDWLRDWKMSAQRGSVIFLGLSNSATNKWERYAIRVQSIPPENKIAILGESSDSLNNALRMNMLFDEKVGPYPDNRGISWTCNFTEALSHSIYSIVTFLHIGGSGSSGMGRSSGGRVRTRANGAA
jgi:hypothetical protein